MEAAVSITRLDLTASELRNAASGRRKGGWRPEPPGRFATLSSRHGAASSGAGTNWPGILLWRRCVLLGSGPIFGLGHQCVCM